MSADNGGPAFPNYLQMLPQDGMTLRDYFAAKAMQTEMLSMRKRFDADETELSDWDEAQDAIASYAYDMADAMLKARQS